VTIEEALVAYLLANGGVSTLIGTRCHPQKLPERPTYPALRYTQLDGPRDMHMQGASGHATPRYQLDAFATTYAQAKALAKAVRLALNGFSGTMGGAGGVEVDAVFLVDERDLYDDDTEPEGLYAVSQDFEIHAHEALA